MWWQTCRRDESRAAVVVLQFILLLLQAALFVLSSVLFVLGSMVEASNYDKLGNFYWSNIIVSTPSSTLVIFGGVVTISALLGLIGNCIGKFWLIRWSFLLGLFIIMVDLVMGIWIFFSLDALPTFTNIVAKSMNDYKLEGAMPVGLFGLSPTDYWDKLQRNGRCCGMNSYTDWLPTRMGRNDNLPSSCCKIIDSSCGNGILASSWSEDEETTSHEYLEPIYQKGCFQNQEVLLNLSKEIGGIGLAVGLILNLTIVLAVALVFVVQLKHRRPLYTIRQLIRCGLDTRIGFEDLNAYKESAKRYQTRKREEYFDRTGGVPQSPADFHPAHVAGNVKNWADNPILEPNANVLSATSTRVWPTNSNDDKIRRTMSLGISEHYEGPVQPKRIRRM